MSQAYEPVAPLDNAHGLGQQQDTSPENLQPPPPSPLVDGQKDVQDNYEAVGDFGDAQYVPGRENQMKIPLWVYAIATFFMFTAATACTISFVTGVVEHWFLT